MTVWKLPEQINISPDLQTFVGDPLLAQLLAQRGLTTVQAAHAFLDPDAYEPSPSTALPDLEAAVARLRRAIEQQELICVWGDFDVDGQTSTALLVSTLQSLGARVSHYIPNRLTESHGLKMPALEQQLQSGAQLILTCDTGIDAHEVVEAANAAGVEIIITDHHDLPDTLPPAQAVINPKRLPETHPLRELPGVGVAYKLTEGLYESYGRSSESEAHLDLVALGIVADVARQTGDTRYLLQRGLARLQQSDRVGLQALIESARLRTERLTEEHISFWLAPRLNALGRLGDANLAVELLTTDNLSRARIIALQLEALNDRRKLLVDRTVVQALGQIEDSPALVEGKNAIVLAAADWHPGIIGIAANRLADQFGRPALLIALRPDGRGHGSARSVPGCDIHEALKSQAHLLTRFGGHPMAAGLTIKPENIVALRRGLSEALADCRSAAQERDTLRIDAVVELARISGDLLATLQRLAPFGAGNPAIRLGCRGLHIVEESAFGKTGDNKRVVVADQADHRQEVIWWRGGHERSPRGTFDLAFSLTSNDYSQAEVQMVWVEAQEWEPVAPAASLEFIDWRRENYQPTGQTLSIINYQLSITDEVIIWAEGMELSGYRSSRRHELRPAEILVVWSAPPDPDTFQQAIKAVQPQQIYLVGQPSPFDTFPAFIKQLMGLVKHALSHKEGEIELDALAAALGHQPTTVRLGLSWLVAQGKLTIYVEEDGWLVLRPAQQPPSAEAAAIEEILKAALAETAAYRQFFREAGLKALRQTLNQHE